MSVAIAKSPVFSPSRLALSCKGSPETVTLTPSSPSSSPSSSLAAEKFRPLFQRAVKSGTGGSSLNRMAVDSSPLPPPASPSSSSRGGASSVMKRKRPGRIDIPPLAEAISFPPVGSDGNKVVEAESARYSVYCKRGKKRLEMEDRHKVTLDINGDPKFAFFGIFDGHGGAKAAEFASENMVELILDEALSTSGEHSCEIEEAVRIGYLKTDTKLLKEDIGGGTCCVTAVIRNGNIVVSNAGDCRAVLCRAGTAEALTNDHRPSREDERHRIESLGGYVDCCQGAWRLQGILAVSRGIGDSQLKQWVIPEPESRKVSIDADCEFLILASDGLWDKVSNQEAVDIARPFCICNDNPSPLSACRKLVDVSGARGSFDDISVMMIQLQHFAC